MVDYDDILPANRMDRDRIMKGITTAFAGLIIIACSACGGGGGGSAQPEQTEKPSIGIQGHPTITASNPDPTTSAPAPVASVPVSASALEQQTHSAPAATVPATSPVIQIEVYGDDAMAGVTINDSWIVSRVSPDATDDLQSLLQKTFKDTGITVANHAVGGSVSSLMNLLDGMDGEGPPFAQRVSIAPGMIIIDNHGMYDMAGETVSDYSGYLCQWIEAVRAAGKIPVLEEPGPVCDDRYSQLPAYIAAMDDVAAKYNVPLIKQYAYIQSIQGWKSHMASCFYPDAYIDSLKSEQENTLISTLIKKLIEGGRS